MWIVITGNPVDGFCYHGPFNNFEEALEWTELNCGGDYWITGLAPPEQG